MGLLAPPYPTCSKAISFLQRVFLFETIRAYVGETTGPERKRRTVETERILITCEFSIHPFCYAKNLPIENVQLRENDYLTAEGGDFYIDRTILPCIICRRAWFNLPVTNALYSVLSNKFPLPRIKAWLVDCK